MLFQMIKGYFHKPLDRLELIFIVFQQGYLLHVPAHSRREALSPFHAFQLLTDLVHTRLGIAGRGLDRRRSTLGNMP
jgi:hypothetical protein